MIELRWVMRPITKDSVGIGGNIFSTHEKVLQYREVVEQTATRWQDVPLVREEE